MRARDIMTRDVITVSADTSVHEAISRLSEHAITSLPVLDEDGNVIGIVSELDLLRGRMPHDPTATLSRRPDGGDPARYVKDVMHEPVICLSQNADLADLAQMLTDNNVRAIPIIDGADLVGIVSRRDLLRTLMRDDTAIATDVARRLDEYAATVADDGDDGDDGDEATAGRWPVAVADGVVTVRGHFKNDHQAETVETLVRTVPGVVRAHINRSWSG